MQFFPHQTAVSDMHGWKGLLYTFLKRDFAIVSRLMKFSIMVLFDIRFSNLKNCLKTCK